MDAELLAQACAPHPDGTIVQVWVVPGAARTAVAGVYGGRVKLRVASPAERGSANEAALRFLSALVGARVELIRGTTSRSKAFLIRDVRPHECIERIGGTRP